jgi:hypothetical protein
MSVEMAGVTCSFSIWDMSPVETPTPRAVSLMVKALPFRRSRTLFPIVRVWFSCFPVLFVCTIMGAGYFFDPMVSLIFNNTEFMLSTTKMSSIKWAIPVCMSPASLPRSYRPIKANSHHAPLPIHVRLAYAHDDDYNVTRNSGFPRRRIGCYGMMEPCGSVCL